VRIFDPGGFRTFCQEGRDEDAALREAVLGPKRARSMPTLAVSHQTAGCQTRAGKIERLRTIILFRAEPGHFFVYGLPTRASGRTSMRMRKISSRKPRATAGVDGEATAELLKRAAL